MQNHISEHSFQTQRYNMIEGQLKPNKIINPAVLEAFSTIARENFVPAGHKKQAYCESKIALSVTRHLMEPMNLAKLIQAVQPKNTDKSLVIGSASGYSAAILAHLTTEVHALENDKDLSAQATTALKKTGLHNICFHTAPLTEGAPKHGPYDLILIDGAISELPEAITNQLSEGGRIVTLLQKKNQFCQGTLYQKNGDNLSSIPLFETEAFVLPGFEKAKSFSFAA